MLASMRRNIANLDLTRLRELLDYNPETGSRRNNSVGLKGASRFYNPGNRARWRSTITVNRKRIFLGLFHTAEEAHEAYCKKAAELHGEFARTE
jgi:hypothetical protein